MIKIKTFGIESALEYDERILTSSPPQFSEYVEDLHLLQSSVEPFQKYPKIIVIGHGGSITTFSIYLRALKGNGKQVFLLNTNEVDLISNLKKEYTEENTVIVCVSKSGTNISNIEAVLQFKKYAVIVVTENKENTLRQIAKIYGWTLINHPDIGGRFSGFTSSAFVPALLFGLPVERIQKGVKQLFEICHTQIDPKDNPAWQIASSLNRLELIGKDEIFLSLYSYYLETSVPLIMQLFHETLGKNGKGWTVVGALAPESQHHTNQRFFGGKKNMVGLFVTIKDQRDQITKTEIEPSLKEIPLRSGTLNDINGIKLAKDLYFEFIGTSQDAIEKKIPFIHIELDKIDSEHIAGFIGLWQMVVFYLAILQDVNPLDQPQVERSKEISFQLRKTESIK